VKITGIRLTNEDAADIVHGAVEGGTNYWAEVKDYKWSTWYKDPESTLSSIREDLPEDFVFVNIREDAEQLDLDEEPKWVGLTKENLERGVIGLIEKYPHLIHGVSNRGEGDVEFDFDATSCDVIVQLAVFGEVVYG
jgi:hypothetical protein